MYTLLGPEIILKNLLALLPPVATQQDLNIAYANFLKKIQPGVWLDFPISDHQADFIIEPTWVSHWTQFFEEDSTLSDRVFSYEKNTPVEAMQQVSTFFDNTFKQATLPPMWKDLFKLIVRTLFYVRSHSDGGGSVSSAVGTIWCSPKTNWSSQDFLEFLIHEFTHQLMFLDELRFGHHPHMEDIANPDNFCISSILKCKRPLDKTFHSLVVAYEIVQMRAQYLGEPENPRAHPPTPALLQSIQDTLDSLEAIALPRNLLTPHAQDLMTTISRNIQTMQVPC